MKIRAITNNIKFLFNEIKDFVIFARKEMKVLRWWSWHRIPELYESHIINLSVAEAWKAYYLSLAPKKPDGVKLRDVLLGEAKNFSMYSPSKEFFHRRMLSCKDSTIPSFYRDLYLYAISNGVPIEILAEVVSDLWGQGETPNNIMKLLPAIQIQINSDEENKLRQIRKI